MYPVPPIYYRRYVFNIGGDIPDTFQKNIDKSIADTYLA